MPTPSVSGVPLQDGERRQHIITATSHVCLLMANLGVFPVLWLGLGACLREAIMFAFMFLKTVPLECQYIALYDLALYIVGQTDTREMSDLICIFSDK